jgi:hypothetical protein
VQKFIANLSDRQAQYITHRALIEGIPKTEVLRRLLDFAIIQEVKGNDGCERTISSIEGEGENGA